METLKKIIAFFFFLVSFLHFLDVFNRQIFFTDEHTLVTYFLVLGLLITSIGFFMERKWGDYLFFFLSISQLISFLLFKTYFGEQSFLLYFHSICLGIYMIFSIIKKLSSYEASTK